MNKQDTEKQRLNKYLAHAGICSRRDADKLIEEGAVLVNGMVASPGMKVGSTDKVSVRGKKVQGENEKVILAFYKPIGVTCTEKDKFADKKILDYVKSNTRVTYAGRLDKDSEGLILLSNDGDLIQAMMKGANRHEKEYVVKVESEITKEFITSLSEGVYLKELEVTTRPCKVVKDGKYTFHITLTQGLNRQIRRMCKELGYSVKSLKRIRVMNITVDGLKIGETRKLSLEECRNLYIQVGMEIPAQFN